MLTQIYLHSILDELSTTLDTLISVNLCMFSYKLYDVPLEMLDIVLQKSYLHWILNAPTKQRDEEVVRSLISVDVCFYRRVTRQRFKKAVWRYLEGEMSSKHYCRTAFSVAGHASCHCSPNTRWPIHLFFSTLETVLRGWAGSASE